jgi:hypothetical protein
VQSLIHAAARGDADAVAEAKKLRPPHK